MQVEINKAKLADVIEREIRECAGICVAGRVCIGTVGSRLQVHLVVTSEKSDHIKVNPSFLCVEVKS